MTNPSRDAVVAAIRTVLVERLKNRHMDAFGPDARLGADLALDSLMTMHLLLYLETDHGLVAPEEAVAARGAQTVGEFAELFIEAASADADPELAIVPVDGSQEAIRREGVHGEDYIDLKIHCYVSCLADGLKRSGIDHRPLFFGVWDAPFARGDGSVLKYHEDGMCQENFRLWAERLYGLSVRSWYDEAATKEENLARLRSILAERAPYEDVMVMLDMYHLQGRENVFNKNPFPHYLLLETTEDPTVWLVRDVDYRWEGPMPAAAVEHAIRQPTVEGGYIIDRSRARPPRPGDLAAYFEDSFFVTRSPLVEALREIVSHHAASPAAIERAVADLPILIVRKYGYEHAFAFFWRALRRDSASFDSWCEQIEALIRALRALNYELLKFARTGDRSLLPGIDNALRQIEAREQGIKNGLLEAFEAWRAHARACGVEKTAAKSA